VIVINYGTDHTKLSLGVKYFDPYDILVNVTKEGVPTELCTDIDNPPNNVLTLTNTTGPTNGITETPFIISYQEKVTGVPGAYHCNVEFIANNTYTGEFTSLANQTVWLNVTGTMGYWKNHLTVADNHFNVILGDSIPNVTVSDVENVTDIFKAHKGKLGANKLAAKLLATAFNIWSFMTTGSMDSYECINDSADWSNGTLSELGYDTIGKNGNPGKELKNSKGNNHTALDNFNNDGCPLP